LLSRPEFDLIWSRCVRSSAATTNLLRTARGLVGIGIPPLIMTLPVPNAAKQMHAFVLSRHISATTVGGVARAAGFEKLLKRQGYHASSDSSAQRCTDKAFPLPREASNIRIGLGRQELHTSTLKELASMTARSVSAGAGAMSAQAGSGSPPGLKLLGALHGASFPLRPSLFGSSAKGQRAFHATNVAQKKRDPYEVLGVPRGATQAEVKKAYFAKVTALACAYYWLCCCDREGMLGLKGTHRVLRGVKSSRATRLRFEVRSCSALVVDSVRH
jgi:hypothetical protein